MARYDIFQIGPFSIGYPVNRRQRMPVLAFAFSGGSSDPTIPTVTEVVPAIGATLHRSDPIAFKILDTGGNLSRTTVLASFPALGTFEVVYFNGAFGPQYAGNRTPIVNGFQFANVIRNGGWPAAPEIVCDPIDAAGNEAA